MIVVKFGAAPFISFEVIGQNDPYDPDPQTDHHDNVAFF